MAKETLEHRIRDPDFMRHTRVIVDSFVTKGQPEGTGIHLGSSLSQLIQVANLDRIDHHIKSYR